MFLDGIDIIQVTEDDLKQPPMETQLLPAAIQRVTGKKTWICKNSSIIGLSKIPGLKPESSYLMLYNDYYLWQKSSPILQLYELDETIPSIEHKWYMRRTYMVPFDVSVNHDEKTIKAIKFYYDEDECDD